MPDRVQDLTNHRKVATACKNYTDKKAEEILWQVGEYSISTSDDNTTASSKTVPSGATRCKIKRVYGNTVKNSPTVASNTDSYSVKTMPTTVYDFDVSKVEGNSEVSENLCPTTTYNDVMNNTVAKSIDFGNLPNGTYSISLNISVNANNRTLVLYYYNNGVLDNVNNIITTMTSTGAKTYTFTLDGSVAYDDIRLGLNSGTNDYSMTLDSIMLVKGSTAPTTFKPYYTGIHNFAWNGVKVEGANLFDTSNIIKQNGYYNASLNWTNDNNFDGYLLFLEKGTYLIKPFVNTYLGIVLSNNNGNAISNLVNFTSKSASGSSTFTLDSSSYIVISANKTDVSQLMLVRGSTAPTTFVPSIAPTTIPIDLSSILYNGSPLFEGNSLKAVGTAKDYITPYKAHKQTSKIVLNKTDYTWQLNGNGTIRYVNNFANIIKKVALSTDTPSIMSDKLNTVIWQDMYDGNITSGVSISISGNLGVSISDYETLTTLEVIFELATPIEVSIDWSSTLRGITGYSNGTITLQNTYNMDTANLINYNSILKENCCAKIVQSRGGSVVKTINLPTVASDGYSAGSVYNVRDLTTSKRIGNVDKNYLKDNTYNVQYGVFLCSSMHYNFTNNQIKFICSCYNEFRYNNSLGDFTGGADLSITFSNTSNLWIKDTQFGTDKTTFKNHFTNDDVLYYELADASKTETSIDAVENIIEVQAGDELAFYDSNNNLVTVPSDLTYRIEVAN